MALDRRVSAARSLTLVPLIDVFMILLVFFLVTSTYLDLDSLPAVERDGNAATAVQGQGGGPSTAILRLRHDGVVVFRGRALGPVALKAELAGWKATEPGGTVVVIPSGAARLQHLATVMDTLRAAGIERMRLVRIEAPS